MRRILTFSFAVRPPARVAWAAIGLGRNTGLSSEENRKTALKMMADMEAFRLDDAILTDDVSWWAPGQGTFSKETFRQMAAGFQPLLAGKFTMTVHGVTADGDRVAIEAESLAPLVSAMMDVSDGLLLDATRMAQASGVTLAIDSSLPPLACPEPRRAEALRWGEDYQLLFTLPAGLVPPVPATRIGQALPPGAAPLLVDGSPPASEAPLGWEHG